jgi:hypothetical protein
MRVAFGVGAGGAKGPPLPKVAIASVLEVSIGFTEVGEKYRKTRENPTNKKEKSKTPTPGAVLGC